MIREGREGRKGDAGVRWAKYAGQLSTLRSLGAPPPSRHLTTTLPSPSTKQLLVTKSWDTVSSHNLSMALGITFPVASGYSTFQLRPRREETQPAKQDVNDCLLKLFELS